MKAGRVCKVMGSIALCGVIWILGEKTYRDYYESQIELVVGNATQAVPAENLPAADRLTVALPSLEELTETVERPMFSQSRRPFEAALDAEEPVLTSDFDVDLLGIVIWQGRRIALVRSNADSQIITVEVGGNVAGWVAVGIEPESVRFRNGETEREVRLNYINQENNG
jgi:hypothetical protein